MNSKIFRIVSLFRKPYPVLLGFPEGKLYLISLLSNIYLDFPKDITLLYLCSLCLVVLTVRITGFKKVVMVIENSMGFTVERTCLAEHSKKLGSLTCKRN